MDNSNDHMQTGLGDVTPPQCTLPRRDLWLLPLISLCTVLLLVGLAESSARVLWSRSQDPCEVNDGSGGITFLKNCHSHSKIPESSWIRNVTNECGYHNASPCTPKPPGTIRLVTLGTSFSYGYHVDMDENYPALLVKRLHKECRSQVDVQNLGIPGKSVWAVARRLNEAIALKPDAIVVSFLPTDFIRDISDEQMDHLNDPSYLPPSHREIVHYGFVHRLIKPLKDDSRALMMLQHFMYEDPEIHTKLYLLHGDEGDYLRTPFTPVWQKRINHFDAILGWMATRSQQTNVPIFLLIGPDSNEVSVIRSQPRPGVDPYAFNAALNALAAKYHIPVIDPLRLIVSETSPFRNFYLADGHMNGRGQTLLAEVVHNALLSDKIAPLAHCNAM